MYTYKPIVLVILDGWGEWDTKMGNPLVCASLPTINLLDSYYPKFLLEASGLAVGLPWGLAGNSEVGHQTIGSGQIMYHYLPTITAAIHSRSFFSNPVLLGAIRQAKKGNSALHLLGLVSDGGVHSHIDHLFALLDLVKEQELDQVFVHAFTDGRDTATKAGMEYIKRLMSKMKEIGLGQIASVSGRYYAMDRNSNWDRVEKAFAALITGQGIAESDPLLAIEKQYKMDITDEYIEPITIIGNNGNKEPIGLIKEGDVVINFNYRADRARQISRALVMPDFDKFKSVKIPRNIKYIGFTEYAKDIPLTAVFPAQEITTRVGKIISQKGNKQLRIAEMEKFAHVTYFFNGGVAEPFANEDRVFVPSKNARTYASVPEMSAHEVTNKLFTALKTNKYDFALVNYANPDMVGHTGDFKAGIKAVEIVDECLGKLIKLVFSLDGCLLVTADHGNIEEMVNLETGEIDTKHSSNLVPFWFVTSKNKKQRPRAAASDIRYNGMIADVASTILDLLNIPIPDDMIGQSLIKKI